MARRPTPRPRATRRARQREVGRALDRLDRLAAELPGGSRRHPLVVPSASVVGVRVRAVRCLRCEGETEIAAETAEVQDSEVFRRVGLVCRACHAHREIWLKVSPPLPS